jgi:hypothetical protein
VSATDRLRALWMRIVIRYRAWQRRRSSVVLTFPAQQVQTVAVASAEPGLYTLAIGERTISVRSYWWDTPASVARKMRRAVRRAGL